MPRASAPLDVERLVRVALRVARQAGALVQGGFRSRPEATEKARADLVTRYDLDSERLIRDRLTSEFPEIALVAEEEGGSTGRGLTWYCDPLDGTTNFVHGHPFWAVSIGLLDDKDPVGGAVVAPALGLEWWGIVGAGAFRGGERCGVSGTTRLEEALLATGFPFDRSRDPDNNLGTFGRVLRRVRGVRRCGSAAIDCCLVADGTYDGYWERRLNAWDLAAGASIAVAAGARLTDLAGGPADLSAGHIVLGNPAIHPALVGLIREDGVSASACVSEGGGR